VALFLLGFAHLGQAFAAPPSPSDYALYALPDGSLPDFCLTTSGEDGNGKPAHKHVCSACRFFAALIALPNDTIGERMRDKAIFAPIIAAVSPKPLFQSPNSSPRGPPRATPAALSLG
jgi:hypothetical protein